MSETLQKYGRTFVRTDHGGWIEQGARLPEGSTARIYDDAVVFKEAARAMFGGEFRGGAFWGGEFMGGEFRGGAFWGGEFMGGEFRGGAFWGGEFMGGEFMGGEFRGGVFRGGVFWGGAFWGSPCCAQRHDGYIFVAKYVGTDLRIWAGCHDFSWDEAIAHWHDGHPHGAESQRIIHFLKAQAEAERVRDAARDQSAALVERMEE